MAKRALVLGIGGQDGSYLADVLLQAGYEVHGMVRRSSLDNLVRIHPILGKVTLHRGDLLDSTSVERIIRDVMPDEIYNEADQDNVGWSYSAPLYSYAVTFSAVGALFESVMRISKSIKVFQPLSATIFRGNSLDTLDESTPLDPQSPYACAKAGAMHLAHYYRERHGLFVSTAILFNHDSPRRTGDYLINKICRTVIGISHSRGSGREIQLKLGNLSHQVDIGHAEEYMQAVYRLMQLDSPHDVVIATGRPFRIHHLAGYAFDYIGMSDRADELIEEDPAFCSVGERLIGNPRVARKLFGFDPQLYGKRLIDRIMYEMLEEEEKCA